MVIVPHQDDEILMTAGVLYQAVKKGLQVHVVMVTNGDCDCPDYTKGRARLRETIAGCRVLGLGEEQLIFLGYADTGMPPEESFVTHLFEERDASRIYPSHCSGATYGLEEKPEFHMETWGEHAPYSREMLKADLKQVIETYRPRNVPGRSIPAGDFRPLLPFPPILPVKTCTIRNDPHACQILRW